MAKFEEEEEKIEDVMLDFGELGRWSKKTLGEHILYLPYYGKGDEYPLNTPLESLYRKRVSEYQKELFELSNWKVGFGTTLRDISWRLFKREELFKDSDKLCEDFQKYLDLFPERIKYLTK